MSEPTLDKSATFAALPAEWSEDLLPTIRQQAAQLHRKLVVLDDDPTGTQTVLRLLPRASPVLSCALS